MQAKNHSLLIDEFKKLSTQSGLKGWRLVLAGGVGVGTGNFVNQLKNQAQNYPIDILPNPDFQLLKKLYGQAKIFWSASGYGIKPQKEPEKCEHFGITIVEAMTSGAVPIVVNQGGHPEIVQHRKSGFLFQDLKQLHAYTLNLIHNEESLKRLSQAAIQRSQSFSTKKFVDQYLKLILQ
jgi:glycosyltransferase involved in cell wall biosynthesis